jgi:hypothetical protein
MQGCGEFYPVSSGIAEMTNIKRECLFCGMLHSFPPADIHERASEHNCSKCDCPLLQQSDGSTITVDIAHARETVPEALQKLEDALQGAWNSYAATLRVIVGGGVIRDAVLAELFYKKSQGIIMDFEEAHHGAVLIEIRE